MNGTACTPTGTAFSQYTVQCLLPSGQGQNGVFAVSISGQTASIGGLNYAPPSIVGRTTPYAPAITPANGPTQVCKRYITNNKYI